MSGKPIVVGVDGSGGSRAALEFALAEAARRKAPLRVVSAVALPEFWATSYGAFVPPPPYDEIVGAVRKETQEFVDEVTADNDATAGVPSITVEVIGGHPAELLVAAADDADLLVVGHRGRGAVSSVLLGSVGLHCVLHAPCPVTVVRSPAEETSD